MATSTSALTCDRCGRLPVETPDGTRYSFCTRCELFVCPTCWIESQGSCSVCALPGSPHAFGPARVSVRDTIAEQPLRAPIAGQPLRAPIAEQPLRAPIAEPPRRAPLAPRVGILPRRPRQPPPAARRAPLAIARWARDTAPTRHELAAELPFKVALATLLAVGIMASSWAFEMANRDRLAGSVPEVPMMAPAPAAAPSSAAESVQPSSPTVYVVRAGDTLRAIARRLLGDETHWLAILEANRDRIDDPENLTIGLELLIPAT